jgi:hypothetical protein
LPGQSREDLALGVPVVLSNDDDSGVAAWNWRLLAKPLASSAGLNTPTSPTCQFTPDRTGSYLIQLLLNGVVQATAIAAVKTSYLGLRVPATGETVELEGWEKAIQKMMGQLEAGIQAGGGGGGGLDRTLVFSDDTRFSEVGSTFVTKKRFRIVRDSNKPPTAWRIVVSLFGDASYDTAECQVVIGSDSIVLPSVDGMADTVVAGTLYINGSYEPEDSLLTFEIKLRLASGSGAANIQYTDVFAVYGAPA